MADIQNIIVDVGLRIDPEGNLERLKTNLKDAAKGSGLEKEIGKVNDELSDQAVLYAEISKQQEKLKRTSSDLQKVRGGDLEKKLNKEFKESKTNLDKLSASYKNLEKSSKKSFQTVSKESGKAKGSVLDFATVLNTGVGTALGLGLGAVVGFLGEAVSGLSEFAREGLQVAIANERIAKGQESANDKIKRFNDTLNKIKLTVGEALLPVFTGFLDIVNDLSESFASFVTDSDRLSSTVVSQQGEFNILTKQLELATEAVDEAGISEQDLANRQDQRRAIIEQINNKYGDYLPNLFDEKTTLEDIAKATEAVNNQFINRINLLVKQEEFNRLEREAVEVAKDLAKARKDQARIELEIEAGREKSGFLNIQAAAAASRKEVERLTKELESLNLQAIEIGRQNIQESIQADPDGTVIEQIQQLELALERVQEKRDVTLLTDTAEISRLDAAIEIIQNRIKALKGEKISIVEPTKEILAGTVAFLQEQIKDLQEELKFRLDIDDFESRQAILSKIRVLNNQIKAANEAFEVSAILKPDTTEILEITPIDVPVNLNIPKASEVINSQIDPIVNNLIKKIKDGQKLSIKELASLTKDQTAKINEALRAAGENRIIDLDQVEQDLSTAFEITAGVTDSIGGLFDTLAKNRIQTENLTEEEVEKIRRNQFNREKAFATAEAAIQGALLTLKLGSQLGLVGTILGGAITIAQIAAIVAQKAPGFKEGVFDLGNRDSYMKIPGPGNEQSDSIPAWLSRGESVISARKTKENYSALQKIDQGATLKPYQVAGQTVFAERPVITAVRQPATISRAVSSSSGYAQNVKLSKQDMRQLAGMVAQKIQTKNFEMENYRERKGFVKEKGLEEVAQIMRQVLREMKK